MELTLNSILIRTSAMFLIALILMRLSGKQSIGELATMDFVVITILGDGFDTIIYGEQPIIAGVDGSPESLRAASLAWRIARAADATAAVDGVRMKMSLGLTLPGLGQLTIPARGESDFEGYGRALRVRLRPVAAHEAGRAPEDPVAAR